ncbi:WGR domain protein [Leptospira kirschneri str. 200801774]|uniref:WGR domain-containing protein n=1 Tax=Leptospira kirschneri TaxID=29507 RepID=UPI0002BE4C6A|nr:WGR domain-containing protein [Leptospira kirschneri]EMO80249.1 WGR domain protein [Leptospira kirschneri str. 200801774]
MKHQLTFQDNKSDKFWNIETSENTFTITYGKSGTPGQSQTKNFDSEEKCIQEARKLLTEKLKKGYIEQGAQVDTKKSAPSPSGFLKEWRKLVNSKNLTEHFSYLADSPSADKTLELLVDRIDKQRMEIDEENFELNLYFKDYDLILKCGPPISQLPTEYLNWPVSFQEKLAKHEYIKIDEYDLYLGDHGGFLPNYLANAGKNWLTHASDVYSPLTESNNWWIYSPEEKNSLGEKQLYFFDHSLGVPEALGDINIGTLFLNRLKNIFEEEDVNRQNEPSITQIVTDVIIETYQQLDHFLTCNKFTEAKSFAITKIAELKNDFRTRHEADKTNGVSLEKNFPERFVADLLALAANTKDAECFQMAFGLLEGNLKNPRIHFNAACYHALTGNKESLLESIRLARALGQPSSSFRMERDFKEFRRDPDFEKAISN